MTTKAATERSEALERLRALISPGDTVYTQVKHVSRSGMLRIVQAYKFQNDSPLYLGFNIAEACGFNYNRNHEGIAVGGCGFDAGFQIVYDLGHYLNPDGFGCIGSDCPSNDHSNGDRDYTLHGQPQPGGDGFNFAHWHTSGGYSLRHRTMG